MSRCKICGGTAELFDVVDFGKTCSIPNVYPRGLSGTPIYYSRCGTCEFIFTEHFDGFSSEQWIREVYNDDYAEVDPEYLELRPRQNARLVTTFLVGKRGTVTGLDFGGGSGFMASLLRGMGWQFDSYDPFGETHVSESLTGTYNITTAFEVFEHLPDPAGAMASIVGRMSRGAMMILIGTGASNGMVNDPGRLAWWYAAPRNGHVSLYSRKSLALLAGKFALQYYSPSRGLHVFSRGVSQAEIITRSTMAIVKTRAAARLARAWRLWQARAAEKTRNRTSMSG